ncbi:uncharacterized protein ASCRUDRAFT_70269 [Ascoidea rubescens DSM 1968]|uniref:Ubiquitin-like protease family profile domain-containing protein n=1 Tax=Ascoidea rubescens DSM 1968 TaxID=1344418 RepID=A0A1D2VHC8_9ASCO|nr:hypothetical protein ASCRUDRAFT_70269 [Ascoidea rubescens DSM 1968]ODV61036.1 hypothetical protein ASCRUDRAFT_70269 [Ascoidea rubescens DSM 1968]
MTEESRFKVNTPPRNPFHKNYGLTSLNRFKPRGKWHVHGRHMNNRSHKNYNGYLSTQNQFAHSKGNPNDIRIPIDKDKTKLVSDQADQIDESLVRNGIKYGDDRTYLDKKKNNNSQNHSQDKKHDGNSKVVNGNNNINGNIINRHSANGIDNIDDFDIVTIANYTTTTTDINTTLRIAAMDNNKHLKDIITSTPIPIQIPTTSFNNHHNHNYDYNNNIHHGHSDYNITHTNGVIKNNATEKKYVRLHARANKMSIPSLLNETSSEFCFHTSSNSTINDTSNNNNKLPIINIANEMENSTSQIKNKHHANDDNLAVKESILVPKTPPSKLSSILSYGSSTNSSNKIGNKPLTNGLSSFIQSAKTKETPKHDLSLEDLNPDESTSFNPFKKENQRSSSKSLLLEKFSNKKTTYSSLAKTNSAVPVSTLFPITALKPIETDNILKKRVLRKQITQSSGHLSNLDDSIISNHSNSCSFQKLLKSSSALEPMNKRTLSIYFNGITLDKSYLFSVVVDSEGNLKNLAHLENGILIFPRYLKYINIKLSDVKLITYTKDIKNLKFYLKTQYQICDSIKQKFQALNTNNSKSFESIMLSLNDSSSENRTDSFLRKLYDLNGSSNKEKSSKFNFEITCSDVNNDKNGFSQILRQPSTFNNKNLLSLSTKNSSKKRKTGTPINSEKRVKLNNELNSLKSIYTGALDIRVTRSLTKITTGYTEDIETRKNQTINESSKVFKKRKPDEIFFPSLDYKFDDNKSMTIGNSDFKCLYSHEWINDSLIDFFLKYDVEQAVKANLFKKDQIHVFTTFFFSKLIGTTDNNYYHNMKRWVSKIDLFSLKYIILPINEAQHWYCIIITGLPALLKDGKCIIYVFDSLGQQHKHISKPLREFICQYGRETRNKDIEYKNINFRKSVVPRQNNSNDCGIHVIFNVRRFLEDHKGCMKLWNTIKPTYYSKISFFNANRRKELRIELRDLLFKLQKLQVDTGNVNRESVTSVSDENENLEDDDVEIVEMEDYLSSLSPQDSDDAELSGIEKKDNDEKTSKDNLTNEEVNEEMNKELNKETDRELNKGEDIEENNEADTKEMNKPVNKTIDNPLNEIIKEPLKKPLYEKVIDEDNESLHKRINIENKISQIVGDNSFSLKNLEVEAKRRNFEIAEPKIQGKTEYNHNHKKSKVLVENKPLDSQLGLPVVCVNPLNKPNEPIELNELNNIFNLKRFFKNINLKDFFGNEDIPLSEKTIERSEDLKNELRILKMVIKKKILLTRQEVVKKEQFEESNIKRNLKKVTQDIPEGENNVSETKSVDFINEIAESAFDGSTSEITKYDHNKNLSLILQTKNQNKTFKPLSSLSTDDQAGQEIEKYFLCFSEPQTENVNNDENNSISNINNFREDPCESNYFWGLTDININHIYKNNLKLLIDNKLKITIRYLESDEKTKDHFFALAEEHPFQITDYPIPIINKLRPRDTLKHTHFYDGLSSDPESSYKAKKEYKQRLIKAKKLIKTKKLFKELVEIPPPEKKNKKKEKVYSKASPTKKESYQKTSSKKLTLAKKQP